MITIAGRDVSKFLVKCERKIVRTYKGDIERTQLGEVLKFPASFITLGFDLEFTAPRSEARIIQQLLLATDTFMFVVYQVRSNDYKGNFSCTTCETEDLNDRQENHVRLTASIVSVDGSITDHAGSNFAVYDMSLPGQPVAVVQGKFGEEVDIPAAYRTGYVIHNNELPSIEGGSLQETLVLLENIYLALAIINPVQATDDSIVPVDVGGLVTP